ncbi:P-II family nitrogen regulator [Marasmitruncus massiliensis]|uniref:P-II family nitrogen regulator n=1 Tax=Marasmitruncus massiliensis TaxID=1944642 RepID=UPI000C79B8F7|nr:P-II family nitrogen regulator [Marasmitruncus massiliensis]
MELNYVISIVDRDKGEYMASICMERELPIVLTALGRGTATKKLLDLYGLESTEKSVVVTIASAKNTRDLILQARKKLYIDIPGNGIMLSIPIKSVGGGKTLAFLSDHATPDKSLPRMNFDHEMIVVIANEGYTEQVMDAARTAGAMGGTVIHTKGTGAKKAEKFYGVSLVNEKEMIFIVAKSSEKAGIISNIVKETGPDSPAGTIVFSLPVSRVAGLRLL